MNKFEVEIWLNTVRETIVNVETEFGFKKAITVATDECTKQGIKKSQITEIRIKKVESFNVI